jgi:hypothetical protein
MFDFLQGNKEIDYEKKPGDIEICLDNKNKPVIIPRQDRFLHTLIIGVSGCGKYAQSFIPMIYQDMQNPEYGITVIEPNGYLSEKTYAMAKLFNRNVVYFNPLLPMCPHFNPLHGEEITVVEKIVWAFYEFNKDSDIYYLDIHEKLLRKSVAVLKRLFGNDVTLNDLSKLVNDTDGSGVKIIDQFSNLSVTDNLNDEQLKEHDETVNWFKEEYFAEGSKAYTDCIALRSQIDRLISNKYLKNILNPSKDDKVLNFNDHLKNGDVVIINTSLGALRDIGKLLGHMLMMDFEDCVFRRPGNEQTRKPNFLYVDHFQVFCNDGYVDMLTMGRAYRVASHIGITSKDEIPENMRNVVLTNARNAIIYPGSSQSDTEYYAKQFNSIAKDDVFTASNIRFRNFGEITYGIVKKNSLQNPDFGKVNYIPKDINDLLDMITMVVHECTSPYKG